MTYAEWKAGYEKFWDMNPEPKMLRISRARPVSQHILEAVEYIAKSGDAESCTYSQNLRHAFNFLLGSLEADDWLDAISAKAIASVLENIELASIAE